MNYGAFKDVVAVYGVPVHHRQYCREARINPLVTTNGYEDIYDLKDNPTQKTLALWLEKSRDIYDRGQEVALLQQYSKEESFKLRLPMGDDRVVAAAKKKLAGFLKRYRHCALRGLPITARVEKSRPKASIVTQAIMALHAHKLEEVYDFFRVVTTAEDLYSPEVQAQAEEILEQNLPFETTLDFLERMEMAKIPNLPEFIGVDPFFAEEIVDGIVCGGKREDSGFIADCEGRFVGATFWDEDVDANFELNHSPRQDSVEERFIQSYFKRKEDYRNEGIARLTKALAAKQKGLQAYREYCKIAFAELKERAKVLAANGIHINVMYQAKREGLDLALVA